MILRPLFCLEDTKNTGLLIFNSLKQKKLIFNFFVNRNWKKLTDCRKRAKILADNCKSHHPIETLLEVYTRQVMLLIFSATLNDLLTTVLTSYVLFTRSLFCAKWIRSDTYTEMDRFCSHGTGLFMSSLFTRNLSAVVRFWRLRWKQEPVLDDIGLFTRTKRQST